MRTVTLTSLSVEQMRQYRETGYLIVRQLFTPKEMGEVREAFMAQNAGGPVDGLSEVNSFGADDPLSFYSRMKQPHRYSELPVGPLARRYLLDPRIEGVLRDLFDDEPLAVQSMFYFKPAGARGQDLHQDNFFLRVGPGTCMAAWLAVDPADEENGGLYIVPGSQDLELACPELSDRELFFNREHVPIPPGMAAVPAIMGSGDMLFFNGNVIHGSYPNRSRDRFRRSFICHYAPASCREASARYNPLLRFDGREVRITELTEGGPCGVAHEAVGVHGNGEYGG